MRNSIFLVIDLDIIFGHGAEMVYATGEDVG
jgi:hypothetical protein